MERLEECLMDRSTTNELMVVRKSGKPFGLCIYASLLSQCIFCTHIVFDSKNSEVSPELADIIEIDRTLYTHWAIYVGDGQVVHVVGEDGNDLPDAEEAVVRKAELSEVVGDNSCRVNNKEVPAKERNLMPKDAELVVKEAIDMVGSTVDYNLLTRNCEHYLTQWKYGQPWSDQASVAMTAIRALRREHKDSTSDGHSFLVNKLNEVLNSPGAGAAPSSPGLIRANSLSFTSSSCQTETTQLS